MLDADFSALVAQVKARYPWRDVPYFQALDAQTFAREDFVATQVQFLFAVVHFNRPMTALMARLPLGSERRVLLENIVAEHGDPGGDPSHEHTFLALLARLGVDRATIDAGARGPEVQAFNAALDALGALDDPGTALAALGMIEDLFAPISAFLGRQIVRHGWLRAEEVVHYATHEVLDVSHAADLYGLCAPRWAAGGASRDRVAQGLALGAYLFTRLYRDLYEARGRRDPRAVRGAFGADGWSVPG